MHHETPTTSRTRGDRSGRARRYRRVVVVVPLLLCCLAGCRGLRGLGKSDDKYELLTAELRTRERELLETRSELEHLRLLTQTYQRQLCPPTVQGGPVFRTEGGVPTLPLKEVALGTGTGGVDEDAQPGDESLMVVVVPRDDDGTVVKVPARVAVTAYEISREGLKTPIGQWNVPAEQLRRTWKSGLLSSGYFVPLQWDKLPASGKVRLVAQLRTLDGQTYEADKDVTVRALPGAGVRAPATIPPLPAPTFPPPNVEELPPPATTPAARLLPPSPLP